MSTQQEAMTIKALSFVQADLVPGCHMPIAVPDQCRLEAARQVS